MLSSSFLRRDDSLHRDVDILHAGRGHGLGFLRCRVLILPAQIDNGFNSQLGEIGPSFRGGLATAEDMVIDLVEIRDAGYFDDAWYVARCFDMGWRCGKREGERENSEPPAMHLDAHGVIFFWTRKY